MKGRRPIRSRWNLTGSAAVRYSLPYFTLNGATCRPCGAKNRKRHNRLPIKYSFADMSVAIIALYFAAYMYLPITHYQKRTHFPICTYCSENHNNRLRAQKIRKSAVWNFVLYSGAMRREKFEHGCTTTNHPLYKAHKTFLNCTA